MVCSRSQWPAPTDATTAAEPPSPGLVAFKFLLGVPAATSFAATSCVVFGARGLHARRSTRRSPGGLMGRVGVAVLAVVSWAVPARAAEITRVASSTEAHPFDLR